MIPRLARQNHIRTALLGLMLGASTLLAGCAAIPSSGPVPTVKSLQSVAATSLPTDPATRWPDEDWWSGLGDPQLSALITEALAGSPSLAAADARLERARGVARASGAALLPAASASGSAGENRQSYNNGIPPQFVPHGWNDVGRASLDLSYEIDFFGRNRAALRAATSERQAAEIEAKAARLVLATAVADAYADLGRAAALRDVRVEALRIRQETAALVTRKTANGLANRGEQRQAEAAVPVAQADLVAAEEAVQLGRNRLAALLGAGPDRGASISVPAIKTLPALGVPSQLALDLVGRRSDIAAARAQTEAAAARIGVARAAFYPNVNLTALVGFQSLGLDLLTRSGSQIGQAGAAISLPLFQGGRLAGNYTAARADYAAAVAQYDDTLIRAVREVADASASRTSVHAQLTALGDAVDRSQEAFRIARARYDGGLSPYLTVLSAEDALLRNRQLQADLQARALSVDIALIRALGGGFHQI
ncbi:efflux transporter outer membrane subunit [Novosphingobium sp. FKTRR1]|uniref:efflux transporter outer membrane subunit n=1 Tax=Novosphingobium sp. FKTRR1 TaxID=2879118 RepID=UPI001CF0395B|nr:efflux transporter outer membrane subunit [Novosphingobium sp. FKTRR1]